MCSQPRFRLTVLAMVCTVLLTVGGAHASTQKQSPRSPAQGVAGALWSWVSSLMTGQDRSRSGPGAHAVWDREGCSLDPNGMCISPSISHGTSRPVRPSK